MKELIAALPAETLAALVAVIGIGLLVRYFGPSRGRRSDLSIAASSSSRRSNSLSRSVEQGHSRIGGTNI